mgnify:CR=1 FL=1
MKISKRTAQIITVLTIMLGILFATSMVFAEDFYSIPTAVSNSSITNIGGMVLTIAQIVGSSVAVIMLIVLAIKYISAAPNDKADIKKHAVVYIVGAIVLFAASALLGIVKNFAGGISA